MFSEQFYCNKLLMCVCSVVEHWQVKPSLVPRLSLGVNEKTLFHTASDGKLGGAWE